MSAPSSDTRKRPSWLQGCRVLFYMPILRDGAGMVNRELGLAAELAERGAKVTLLSHFTPTMRFEHPGVAVERLIPSRYYDWFYKFIPAYPGIALLVFLRLLRLRPQLVFVDLHQEAIWILMFRRFFGYKVVFTYHGVADSSFYSGAAAKELDRIRAVSHRLLPRADRVIVVSDFLLAETGRAGVDAVRLHNGVELDRFNPSKRIRNLSRRGPLALFVGRYTEYKGALNVVRAFIRARQTVPDAELVMHGFKESGDYMRQMQAELEAAGCADAVHLFGPVDGREMAYHVTMADVFINGSTDETFCMPLLEAQACGVPVVAFAAGGIPEVVADGKTGLLAPPVDTDAFGDALARLLTDRAFYDACVAATADHVAAFTYPVLCDALLDIVEPLMIDGTSAKPKGGAR